jgi:hypothetical protein
VVLAVFEAITSIAGAEICAREVLQVPNCDWICLRPLIRWSKA